jgi:glycosyltransferase involved in cell wall biosynthesis
MAEVKRTKLFRSGVLSILIPAYNERAYVRSAVERVLAVPLPGGLEKEIILIDDGSSDGTAELIRGIEADYPHIVRAVFLEKNQGKGAAINRGIQEMTGEYAVFQDADLEYDPHDLQFLLQPILQGVADVVYGSRFCPRGMRRVFNYHHAVGNKFLTHLSNVLTGLDLTDMETGYKAFRSEVLKTIPIRSKRFGVEPEITAKVAKRGCAVYEVPINYFGRTYAEGKKIDWKDGFSAIFTILKYFFIDDCYDEKNAKQILESLSHARRMNKWLVATIEGFLGDRILEIGSGIGNISRMLPKKELLTVSDKDPIYLEILEDAFKNNDRVRIAHLDVRYRQDFETLGRATYDTVVCINVLEHIEDDIEALQNMRYVLKPGGKLVLLVPQYPALFGSYDEVAGHVRRYTRRELAQRLHAAGYRAVWIRDFNSMAIPGWWLNSCVLKQVVMSKWQLKLYDSMTPFLRILEKYVPLPGLSLICVAQHNSPENSLHES